MGDANISPSVLGVGRHPLILLVSLKDGRVKLEGAEDRLVLLEILEPPDAEVGWGLWVESTLVEEKKQLPIREKLMLQQEKIVFSSLFTILL